MKKTSTLFAALCALALQSNAQNDLGISYSNYSNGQYVSAGDINMKFEVTNYGPATLKTGDTVYVGSIIAGTYYDLSLFPGATAIVLKSDLGVNQSFTYDPGKLNGALTLAFLGKTTADFAVIVYGKGKASVSPNLPADSKPSNNITSVTYNEAKKSTDLGIAYTSYTNGQIINSGSINMEFTITNNGPFALSKDDTLFVGAKIGGFPVSFDLLGTGPTAIILSKNVGVGETYTYNPGSLNGAITLGFLGLTSGDFSLTIYGKGKASIAPNFPTNLVLANNEVSVTYNETVTGIAAEKENLEVKTYPNPVVNEIHFQFATSSLTKVTLTDMTGKLVKEIFINSLTETMDVSGLEKGMYLYSVYATNGIAKTGRVVLN